MKRIIVSMALSACVFVACNSKSGTTIKENNSSLSSEEKNKETALNSVRGIAQRDVDAIYKDFANDFVEYGSGESQPTTNRDSMKAELKEFFTAFPDFRGENLHAVSSGDTVIIIGVWSGTFKSEYKKVKPTGKSMKFSDADIYTFNTNGKITSHRSVQSFATVFNQLGIPTLPESN